MLQKEKQRSSRLLEGIIDTQSSKDRYQTSSDEESSPLLEQPSCNMITSLLEHAHSYFKRGDIIKARRIVQNELIDYIIKEYKNQYNCEHLHLKQIFLEIEISPRHVTELTVHFYFIYIQKSINPLHAQIAIVDIIPH